MIHVKKAQAPVRVLAPVRVPAPARAQEEADVPAKDLENVLAKDLENVLANVLVVLVVLVVPVALDVLEEELEELENPAVPAVPAVQVRAQEEEEPEEPEEHGTPADRANQLIEYFFADRAQALSVFMSIRQALFFMEKGACTIAKRWLSTYIFTMQQQNRIYGSERRT
ncbi:hypothetical protein QUF79_19990 [Fictibacillus enclensis]|uniref:hypothetical protein n=1 Tax=Fictibacillus enclensis TaxID=1017270 RepID=UPI0025A151CD|nr:hypothetical protein [Fictibacillus enclensis]MDM5200299.1 hypothetical protein [Fictibacillus enclensis]